MKPYVTMEEVISTQGADSRTHRFLTAENGCTNGCSSGTTIYASNEFSDKPGVHDDLIFPIKAGDSFVALAGVAHTIRTKEGCQPVKVFWFHSAK